MYLLPKGGADMMAEEGRKLSKSHPSPTHLKWVIEGRARNQRAALKLYELIKEGPRSQDAGKAQELTAVAFSLWRAVFLADRTGQFEAKLKDAEEFLAKMITDNAIGFAQDRSTREWTFNYYITNARLWLKAYGCDEKVLRPPKGERTPRKRWDCLQLVFEQEVDRLGRLRKKTDFVKKGHRQSSTETVALPR
jgi:hypothetical protein